MYECEEDLISRSATRPFLKVRHESFVGVNGQTLGKTKIQASTTYVGLAPQNKNYFAYNFKRTSSVRKLRRLVRKLPAMNLRVLLHAAIVASAVGVVFYGTVSAAQIGISNPASGIGASTADDPTSTLVAGSILAQNADSLITNDVTKKASDASGQVTLATAGDNFLAKKEPLITAGNPTRDIIQYSVAGGDTLSQIAQKFSVTTNTILWANNLGDEATIKPGQNIAILPVSGVLHTVADGDTPTSIASKYQANASLIESYNNLSGDPLLAGTKLIVPEGVIPQAPKPVVQVQPALLNSAFNQPKISFRAGGANSYAYGYCTWYVASRRYVPNNWGNAISWYYNAQASGYSVGGAARAGAIAWEGKNHVAYVESVNGDGTVTVSEMNFWGNGGGWNRVSRRTVSAGYFRYIY